MRTYKLLLLSVAVSALILTAFVFLPVKIKGTDECCDQVASTTYYGLPFAFRVITDGGFDGGHDLNYPNRIIYDFIFYTIAIFLVGFLISKKKINRIS
jgi:hypothetical protein